jgi:arsenate reductase
MKTNPREILIYYNPDSNSHRQVIAYAKSLARHVKTYAFSQAPSTGTSWQQIINTLGMHPRELMNKSNPYYQEHIRGRDFDAESWIKVLMNNPDLIIAPIAIRGDRALLCRSATDILKLQIIPASV